MAAAAMDISDQGADTLAVADFQALEERVLRAVELLKAEREAHAAATAKVEELERHSVELERQLSTRAEQSTRLESEIGQLQSSDTLQTTLTGLAQQNQIGAASSLIGKAVAGLDANNNSTSGVVSSVNVASAGVTLGLSNGDSLSLASVTSIAPASTTDTGASTTATTPAAN